MGLRVVLSDRVTRLWEALAARVEQRRDPFERLVIATPSRVVERRAELFIARTLGIAGNLEQGRLTSVLEARVAAASGKAVLTSATCESLVRDVLLTPERLQDDALAAVRRYVAGEPGSLRSLRERRACELASRMARLYASYTHDRPELVLEWLGGELGASELARWQGALLREALAPFEAQLVSMAEGVASLSRAEADAPLVVAGYSYLTRLELTLLRAIATRSEVLVLTPTPCAEFWEDATRRAAEQATESESVLLASWGTAAREHVAALDAATDYAADRDFTESIETSVLGRVQASVRERRAVTPAAPAARADRSLVVVGAPSLRREVEVVAGEIWARVHAAASSDAPLRFPDIAVWVPSRDRDLYLPQIETIFAEAHDIPWSGVDLALAARSRVVEALVRLVTLIAEGPTRAGLLDVLLHPLVLARLPAEPSTDAIALAFERLGVFFGAEASELPAAYADDPRAIDLGQAIERLALGQMMLGERSGEPRFFERDADGRRARWLPEELDLDGGGADFLALLRSLASDVSAARAASLPIEGWARFFVALGETYLAPDGPEEAEQRRALLALRSLGGPSFEGGAELACGAACELALRALEALPAARGASDRGVLVGALGPHRASEHRLVFVLGLGEGRFPAHEADTGLDLRAGERRACEVGAEDRDRLSLLEALVSARDALVVSWVARDEQTGDEIAPAHAVSELRAAAGDLVVDRPSLRRDVTLLDATRAEGAETSARTERLVAALAFPIAAAEARARTLGDAERSHWAESPLPLAELARDLPADDARRELLALPPIPLRPAVDSVVPVRVSLREIRDFLDCSIQGTARRIVGRSDDDDASSVESEPFDLDDRAHDELVRALVLGALGVGEASIETLAARRAAHGAFPLGSFGARARALAEQDAEQLLATLRRARPGARAAAAIRFGAGREHGDPASRALDPISLGTLPDGRALELVGTTAPLLEPERGGDAEPIRFDLGGAKTSERKQVAELRLALHAFVDHAAMSLGAAPSAKPRRGLVVSRRGATDVQLAPLRADLARRWLAGIAKEIALDVQTSFMPIESVLRVAHLFTRGSEHLERDLARSIETVRGPKWEGGRSRFGPVRDAIRLPAPAAPARVAGQRFSIFFAHLRAPAVQAPGPRGGP